MNSFIRKFIGCVEMYLCEDGLVVFNEEGF